jgi:hypothetical protein
VLLCGKSGARQRIQLRAKAAENHRCNLLVYKTLGHFAIKIYRHLRVEVNLGIIKIYQTWNLEKVELDDCSRYVAGCFQLRFC